MRISDRPSRCYDNNQINRHDNTNLRFKKKSWNSKRLI